MSGFAAARGGRSGACTVRPRGTGDGGTNIAITSDVAPRASARCETSSASPDAGGGPCGSPTAPERDAPDQPLPAHVYVRENRTPLITRRGCAGESPFHGRTTRFGGPHTVCAAEPLTPPSPPRSSAPPLARTTPPSRGGLSSSPARSRDRSCREGEPRRLPSSKSPRPATSFRTPGSDLPLAPWRCLGASFATPFHRGETSRTSVAGPPCTRPVAGGSRFLDLGFACRLLLISERRADSPWRAFDPRRCELP